jgi:dihydrofolate synthase / folylpolyglutamate synthase
MLYRQALNYMYEQLPMFQRVGSAAYKNNLDNTIAISKHLDCPEKKFKSIHIAGTNGKGSSSHLLASIFQEAGYKTGLYTSPHLKDFRERIKINGAMIPKKTVSQFIEKNASFFNELKPSFFEMTVGMAFGWFADQQVDIAIIETGLGGRLDSTNIIHPELSLITNVSFDHTQLLGSTLTAIAAEKAGIIKSKTPVIISEKNQDYFEVFKKKAEEENAGLIIASAIYEAIKKSNRSLHSQYEIYKNGQIRFSEIDCPLQGNYQQYNICGVLAVCDAIQQKGFKLSENNIAQGIKKVIVNTGFAGRWQVLQQKPLTIADTGHNEAGIQMVLNQIQQIPHKNLNIVLGMVNDKEIDKMLNLFPKNARYFFCQANIPRALDKAELMQKAVAKGLNGKAYASVKKALRAASQMAGSEDLVFVGGSTFVVAEVV